MCAAASLMYLSYTSSPPDWLCMLLLAGCGRGCVRLTGACGGELACSTCHVVLEQEYFDRLPPKSEEEEDMLDLAWGVTDRSRLGCQLKVCPDFQGMRIVVPSETNSML